eukprot:1192915-Prorocentrum_minimum.AAC.2
MYINNRVVETGAGRELTGPPASVAASSASPSTPTPVNVANIKQSAVRIARRATYVAKRARSPRGAVAVALWCYDRGLTFRGLTPVLPFGDVAPARAGGFPGSASGFPTLMLSNVTVLPCLRMFRWSYTLSRRWFQKLGATLVDVKGTRPAIV